MNKSILVIDDEVLEGDFVSANLTEIALYGKLNYITQAKEAIDVLSTINALASEIVVLDLNLPGLNVSELIDYFKQHEELMEIPIYIMSADSEAKMIALESTVGALGLEHPLIHEGLDDLMLAKQFWKKALYEKAA